MFKKLLKVTHLAVMSFFLLAAGNEKVWSQTTVFINEIHYDNDGTDAGEAIEIAGPAGTDLTGWRIVRYNGSGGGTYTSPTTNEVLSGSIPNMSNGFGFVVINYPSNGIQNGDPDGIALVDNNNQVVQFLSYEGSFTATNGPAQGISSISIGVAESSTTPAGYSLQLTGTGSTYQDFTWAVPASNTFGTVNSGQTFQSSDVLSLSITDVAVTEGNTGTTSATFTVNLSKPAPAGGVTFDIATTDNTATVADNDYQANSLTTQSIASRAQSYTFTVLVNGDTEFELTETFFVNITNVSPGVTLADGQGTGTITNDENQLPVYVIQGSGASSDFIGQKVITIGVVTGDYQDNFSFNGFQLFGLGGYYLQDVNGDGNTATSDGIFVFNTSLPVVAGELVRVYGTVSEFNGVTQITSVTKVEKLGTGNTTTTPVTLPLSNAADLEKYEGMKIVFSQSLTVTENFNLGRFGELVLSREDEPTGTDGRLFNPTNFIDPTDVPAEETENDENNVAAVTAQQAENNLSKILLDDLTNTERSVANKDKFPVPYVDPQANTLRVGTKINNLPGFIDFRFGSYRIRPAFNPYASSEYKTYFTYDARPEVPSVGNANVKVASFNVLNYFNGDGQGGGFPTSRGADSEEEFKRQQDKVVTALMQLNADIVGLMEIENDGDGEGSAIDNLVDTLNAKAGAGTYNYIRDPQVENGTGTDEIKVAFLYKPEKVMPLGPARADTDPVHNRPPLAQTFKQMAGGERFTVVVNHFKSKRSGDGLDADQGDGQGRSNFTRIEQAKALLKFVSPATTTNGDDDIMLIGDFNAYFEEDPIDVLRAGGFESLFSESSYSFVFQGQSGSLDHALVTKSLQSQITGARKWHINADEPRVLDYNAEFNPDYLYQPNPYRSSDHDPLLVGIKLDSRPATVAGRITELLLSVSPNPTNGMVNIVTELQNETIEATLRSPEGGIIYSGKGNAAELSEQISNALQGKPFGFYQLQMIIAGEVVNTRILKF